LEDVSEGQQSFEVLAADSQANIRKVLRWLSQAEPDSEELAKDSLAFLRSSIEGTEWKFLVSPSLFYVEAAQNFRSVMSPVCLFIWRQLERFHEGGELKEI